MSACRAYTAQRLLTQRPGVLSPERLRLPTGWDPRHRRDTI